MKKNKTMRAASGLLIATLLSTSVVSGTYAKYVTSDSGQDQARVAKFGVVASISGDLFGDSYAAANGNTVQAWAINNPTVSADTQKTKIVAPGTKSNKGLTFSVTGKPEVSTKLIFDAKRDDAGLEYVNSDITLMNGSYGVMVETKATVTPSNAENFYTIKTDANGLDYYAKVNTNDWASETGSTEDAKFKAAYPEGTVFYELKDLTAKMDASTYDINGKLDDGDYLPITWKIASDATSTDTTIKNRTFSSADDLFTALQDKFGTAKAPNVDLGDKANGGIGSDTITWEWGFEPVVPDGTTTRPSSPTGNNPTIFASDTWDTILGDMIAKAAPTVSPADYTVVKFDLGTSATMPSNCAIVKYAEVNASSSTTTAITSDATLKAANTIWIAYTGKDLSGSLTYGDCVAAASATSPSTVCAVLTESFGAQMSVVQVD